MSNPHPIVGPAMSIALATCGHAAVDIDAVHTDLEGFAPLLSQAIRGGLERVVAHGTGTTLRSANLFQTNRSSANLAVESY